MDFRTFEQAGWERIADAYHHQIAPLTQSAIPPLLSALRVEPHLHLLDVACGPGHLAASAGGCGAFAIGLDFSERMSAVANSMGVSGLAVVTGDAEQLPFADESFDLVSMNFGILHFPDPDRALQETWRVLKPGGRLGLTAWTPPEPGEGLAILNDAVRLHGSSVVDLPPAPDFFRFGNAADCCRALSSVGFRRTEILSMRLEWVLPSNEAFFAALWQATVRGGALLQKQTAEAMVRIRSAMEQACTRYHTGTSLRIPMPALLAVSEK